LFPNLQYLLPGSRATAGPADDRFRPFVLPIKNPSWSVMDPEGFTHMDQSAVNGSSAMVLALFIAVVSWR